MKVYKSVPMGFDIDQSYGTASDHLYCRVQDSGHRWFWFRLVFCFVLLILFPLNLQPRSQATPHQTRTITHQRQATGESHTAIINPILSSHVGCYNLYRDTKRVPLRPTCCTRCTPSFAGSLSVPKTKNHARLNLSYEKREVFEILQSSEENWMENLKGNKLHQLPLLTCFWLILSIPIAAAGTENLDPAGYRGLTTRDETAQGGWGWGWGCSVCLCVCVCVCVWGGGGGGRERSQTCAWYWLISPLYMLTHYSDTLWRFLPVCFCVYNVLLCTLGKLMSTVCACFCVIFTIALLTFHSAFVFCLASLLGCFAVVG